MTKFPFKIVDLTHNLSKDVPTWDGSCGFEHHLHHDYDQNNIYKFRTNKIKMNEGIGTHIDAPAHCIPGSITIDQLSLQNLIAPCIVIDVSNRVHERYNVSVLDIQEFEKTHGTIQPGSFIIVRTGWEKFWHTPDQYRNNLIYPSIAGEAANFLLERQIVGLGIDTLSPDRPEDGYPVHAAILGVGKYIIENIANSETLPPVGSYTLALPIKIKGGTESPIRLIALIN